MFPVPPFAVLAAWILHGHFPGFSIYEKPRDDDRGGYQYRATGIFRAPLAAVAGVVLEPIKHGTLPGLVREEVIVDRATERVVRDVWRFPVISERDTCIRVDIQRGERRWRLAWAPAPAGACPAPADGVVRMAANEGFWELETDPETRATRFTTEVYSDPGGWIPQWLSQSLMPGRLEGLIPAIDRAACAAAGDACR